MKINKFLTPYNLNRLGNTSRIKYIVIHYVGATGGAEANCRYYASKYIGASAHYYVGFSGEIWQSVEDGVLGIKEARQQTAGTGTLRMPPFGRLLN